MDRADSPQTFGRLPWWSPYAALVIVCLVILLGTVVIHQRLDAIEDRLAFGSGSVHVPTPLSAAEAPEFSGDRHAVYVPVYSHIYSLGGRALLLETTLSIRNTDPDQPLAVTTVRYYDTDGRPVRAYVEEPLAIGPLATAEFLVEAKDVSGGSGANFVIEWIGPSGISPPLIEAVAVGLDGTQGLAFVSPGRDIE